MAGVVVLDTHAWLWLVDSPARLTRDAARAIERAERVAVSAMAVLELAELIERERIRVDEPTRSWVRQALARSGVDVVPLTPEIAVDAAQLRFAGDPFDRVVYATARAEDAKLVTRDERLRSFDPGRTVW